MYTDYFQVTHGMSVALCQQTQPQQQQNNLCATMIGAFFGRYSVNTQPVLAAFLILPPLVGMFVGAPLVARELESGTFRLIWTQSVTRLRWLLTTIGGLALIILLVFAAFIPLVFWWKGPFAIGGDGIGSQNYPIEGILPLAYMAFALALGIAAGALLRRTVPAMFATLAVYVAVALAIGNWGRPNWLPPIATTWNPYLSEGPTNIAGAGTPGCSISAMLNKAGQRIGFGDACVSMRAQRLGGPARWIGLQPMYPGARLALHDCLAASGSLLGVPGHRERRAGGAGSGAARADHLAGTAAYRVRALPSTLSAPQAHLSPLSSSERGRG